MSLCCPSRVVTRGLAGRAFQACSYHAVRTLSTDAAESGQFFALTEDQSGFKAVADDFAARELLPFAARWDADKHFPVKTLVKAAELGFGGILVAEDVGEVTGEFVQSCAQTYICAVDLCTNGRTPLLGAVSVINICRHVGGSGLGRADAAVIFEALAYGDISVTAYLTIHNMVANCIDK